MGAVPILTLVVGTGAAQAQVEGDLDATYGSPFAPGREIYFFDAGGSLDDVALGVGVDQAGRAVAVGWVSTADATFPYTVGIARFTARGELDPTFGGTTSSAGSYLLDLAGSTELPSRSVAFEPDGSIVVAATRYFSSVATAVGYFARLSADGAALLSSGSFNLPTTPFALPPKVRGFVRDIDGSYVAYGDAHLVDQPFVARLTSSFALDPAFGTDGWVAIDPFAAPDVGTSAIQAMTLDAQGRMVAAISGTVGGGDDLAAIVRLLPAGELDPSFGMGGVARVVPSLSCEEQHCLRALSDVVVSATGEIFAVGSTTPDELGAIGLGWIVKLSDTGVVLADAWALPLDPADGLDILGVAIDPRGGLLVAGTAGPPAGSAIGMHAARYEAATLTVDPNFGLGGRQEFDFIGLPGYSQPIAGALAMALDAGRPLLAGTAVFGPAPGTNNDFAVARLYSRYIFLDDFESGTVGRWSGSSGAP